MAQPDIDQLLRARVTAFLDELSTLVRRVSLEAVLATLEGAEAAGARSAPQRRGRRPARAARTIGRADAGALEARLLEYVAQHPGQRTEEIARGLRVPSSALKPVTKRLCAEKRLKTSGARRGTKYFLRNAAPAPAPKQRAARKPAAKQQPAHRSQAARTKKKAATLTRSRRVQLEPAARKLPQKSVVSAPRRAKPTRAVLPRVKPVTAQPASAQPEPVAVAPLA